MRLGLTLLFLVGSAVGQNLNQLEWRAIGPAATGGRVSDIEAVRAPGRPAEVYVGTASGGIFKSVNEGVSWTPVFDRAGAMMSIGAVAVAPSNHSIVWAGTGEANNRQSSSWGDGVYRSTDGGIEWQRMGLDETRHIGRIAVHPTDPNTVYVAAAGHLWGSNAERGVYKTSDAGATWKKVLFRDENTGAIDLALDPKEPEVVFAALYQRQRKGWGFNGGGRGSGVFRTTDGGATWTELKRGLPPGDKGRIGLALSPVDHRVIYALVEAEAGGLFRSIDRGENWEQLTTLNPRPMYFSRVVLDPKDANRVYLLGSNRGLYVSDDAGRSFRDVFSAVHGEDHALWIDPDNTNHLIAGGDGGVSVSFDRGVSWLFRPNLPIGQFYNISANQADPFLVCGGLQDNGSWCTPSATGVSYGVSFKEAFNVGGGDGMHAIFEDDRTLVVSSQNGAASRLDLDTMQSQSIGPVPPPERPGLGTASYRWYWTTPMIVSRFNPNTIYTGANVLFRSEDRGASWKVVSPDLTGAIDRESLQIMGTRVPANALSRHDGQANFSALTAIAESPLDRNLLYTGADDGTVQRTRDGGKHWSNLTANIAGAPSMLNVSGIVASRHAAGRVYLALDGHFDDRYDPYLYASEDFGATWRAIGAGLPRASVRRVREHPVNPDLIVAGTEKGLYASFDRGGHWIPVGNLPPVPVYDVLFQEQAGALVAGTHGRGIWVLNNVEFFDRLTADPIEPRLFPPAPVRHKTTFPGQFWFGSGEFFAPNPPSAAVLSFYLPRELPNGVDLAIQDSAGQTVRALKVPAHAGLNRACWDLRWAPAMSEGFPAPAAPCTEPRGPEGPLAATGRYTVTISGPGLPKMAAELSVGPDPRSRITPAERKAHDESVMSAYRLQRQLIAPRRVGQELNAQLANVRVAAATGDTSERAEQAVRELARAIGLLNASTMGAARVQNQIDGYEGAPSAAQLRELDWAWQDAVTGVAALNRVIEHEMPSLYTAAGGSRWTAVKPVPTPKR